MTANHCSDIPAVFTTTLSFSWSAFINAASSPSDIGLPGMSDTESWRCTSGFCRALLMALLIFSASASGVADDT